MNELKSAAGKALRGKPFTLGDTRSGRKPGAKNKTTKVMKKVFVDTFTNLQQDPKHSLTAWAKKNPSDFYKLVAKVIPNEVRQSLNFIDKSNANAI